MEKLVTLATEAQHNDIEIEGIPADSSGRSFCVKTSDGVVSYFWCSEKSKLLGTELRRKMTDLLAKKPSLADLTGISDSRLNCFATHFRTYLNGAAISTTQASDGPSTTTLVDSTVSSEINFPQLGPGSSFLEESPRKTVAREKLRSISEHFDASATDSLDPTSEEDKHREANAATHSMAFLNFLDIAGTELPREVQPPSSGSLSCQFTPQYCWCPPVATPMQSTIGKPHLIPGSSTESALSLSSLPPLSVLLADIPPIDFTALPTEPLVHHIPTFTPLICDPIAHVPVINVCSSGQGYLVSGGHSGGVVDPLLPKTGGESLVEKSARETLRMLISGQSKEEGISGVDAGMSSMEAVLSLPDVKQQRCVWRENLKDKKDEELE